MIQRFWHLPELPDGQSAPAKDHKTSLKCQFFEIKIYTSSESWINNISIGVWFVKIGQYLAEIQLNLKIWNLREQKNLNRFWSSPNKVLGNAYY